MVRRSADFHSYLTCSSFSLWNRCFLFFYLFSVISFILVAPPARPGAGKYNALFSIEKRPEGRVLRKRGRWGIILIFFSPFDFSFVSLKETFAVESQGEGNFLHKDSATIWFNYIGSEAIKARLTGISMISVSALILHSWSLKLDFAESRRPLSLWSKPGFCKGGSHWVIQRLLTRLSPEYCRLFAYKKAYKGGRDHMHPRTPLATP